MSTSTQNEPRSKRLTWSGCRTLLTQHWLRRSEIPLGHVVSLPLPTRRLGAMGFAFQASAPVREPGHAWRLAPPDRHGVIAAAGGALLLYAHASALPLSAAAMAWVTVSPEARETTPQALQARLLALDPIMDVAAEAFFDGAPARHGDLLAAELLAVVGPAVFPFFEAMAPDFILWLRSNAAEVNA